MKNAGHVIVNGHHLNRVMPEPYKNAKGFLKRLKCLFVGVSVKVDDTCQEGDFVVMVNL
jgi:hypothetical protein